VKREGKDVKQVVNTKNYPLLTTYYPLKGESVKMVKEREYFKGGGNGRKA